VPATLNSIERLEPSAVAITRQFVLGGKRGVRTINGQSMTTSADMMNMANTLRARLGDVERCKVVNTAGQRTRA
jgi:hypothetical protein